MTRYLYVSQVLPADGRDSFFSYTTVCSPLLTIIWRNYWNCHECSWQMV